MGYMTTYVWLPNFKMVLTFSMNQCPGAEGFIQSYVNMITQAVEQAVSYAYPNEAVPLLPANALSVGDGEQND